jgi:phage-related minor tail protein
MGQAVSKSMADEVDKAGGKSGVLGKAFAGVAVAAVGVFAGVKLLGGFLSEAQEAQTVAKQTAAVLKSTGGAAQVSAKGVDMLSTALSKKSGIDDEVIASGANVLLTFTKVANQAGKGNDIFNQGASIALDMSRALGTDLQGSVIQVGKALNDPIKGITALQRVGVSFTEQQKEQIKTLVVSGDTLGAQKVILASSTPSSVARPRPRRRRATSSRWRGATSRSSSGLLLLPVFEKVAGFLSDVLPKAADFATTAARKVGQVVGDVWEKIGPTVIGALSAAWDWIQSVWPKVRDTVIRVLSDIVTWVKLNWDNIRDILVGVFDALKTAVSG